ncbi:hypothetical protein [Flavobacterium sp.]|uniref:hypothetical protein n=1 Tax=Flavobacterium sp. TaxID=239 RepID=UPI004047A666
MQNTLDSSTIIGDYLSKNRIRKAALARKLNKSSNYIMYLQKRPSLQTQSLWELCHALEHNFFQDLADLLPSTYSAARPETDTKDATIAQLQEEIKILKAEKEVLLQVLKK